MPLNTDHREWHHHARIAAAIFSVLLFSYAYFPPMHNNVNPVAHMALAVSLVEKGTTAIDDFHELTDDRSVYGGSYYSNKSPGLALAAVPAVAVISRLADWAHLPGDYVVEGELTSRWSVTISLTTLLTSGMFTAATGVALYLVALHLGASVTGAVLAALAFGLASPAWGWATNFFSHALAGALLFLGFTTIYSLITRPATSRRGELVAGAVAGWLLSWAGVVEYTAGLAAGLIGLYGLVMARSWPHARLVRVIVAALVAAVPAAVALLAYNAVSFGSPFVLGYEHDPYFEGVNGLLGISFPSLEALYGITLSPYRGLLVFSPLALLYPVAVYRLAQAQGGREIAWLSVGVVLCFLWFNASFHFWHGGGSTGPRYLVPMLPFLFLPYAHYWTSLRSAAMRALVLTLLALGFAVSLLSVSTTMGAWEEIANPISELLLPRFLAGDLRTVFLAVGWRSGYALVPYLLVLLAGLGVILALAARRGGGRGMAGEQLALLRSGPTVRPT